MTSHNRPEYLKKVLEGLSKNDNLDKFILLTAEEPGCEENQKLFSNVDFIEIKRTIRPEKFGCNKNTITAINDAFNDYDFVCILEEDVVPSSDFLNFILWGNKEFKDNKDIFNLSGWFNDKDDFADFSDFNDICKTRPAFNCWGWATWKDRWNSINFNNDTNVSWDTQIQRNYINGKNLKEVYPVVSRVTNIGEVGTYTTPEFWNELKQYVDKNHDSFNLSNISNFNLRI